MKLPAKSISYKANGSCAVQQNLNEMTFNISEKWYFGDSLI